MASGGGTKKPRPLSERFETAVSVIKSLPKEGSFQPSNTVKLRFYALYKQAKEGPCTLPKPSFWDAVGRAKWEAWSVCGKMSTQVAMQMYVEELQQLVEAMPHSPEIEKFLESIGPYYEEVSPSASDDEAGEAERRGGSAESEGSSVKEGDVQNVAAAGGGGGGGGGSEGVDGGRGDEQREGSDDDVEVDGSPVKSKEEANIDAHLRTISSDSDDDFQDSFQQMPTSSLTPPDTISLQSPSTLAPNTPLPAVQQLTAADSRRTKVRGSLSRSGPKSVTLSVGGGGDSERHREAVAEGSTSVENLLPQVLRIQSSLQTILQQLSSLISSISTLPQLHPLPHPPNQVRSQRRRVLYCLLPFLLGWPFLVKALFQFLNKRFGSGSESPPGWVVAMVTFLHTLLAVTLFTVSLYQPAT